MRPLVQPALVVILAGVAAALHLTKLIPALPVLQSQLGLSLVQAGFLLSAVQLAGMMLGLMMGLAADALGLRRSLLTGLAILSVASVAGTWVAEARVLMVLRVVEGAGFLLAVTPAPGLIRRLVKPEQLGKLLGLWSAYMPLATALALWFGPLVMLAVGWPGLWMLLAAMTTAMALWVWRLVPPDDRYLPAPILQLPIVQPQRAAKTHVLRRTLTHSGPWLVALCFSVYSFQWLAVVGFLPTVYAQAGMAVTTMAFLTGLVAAANMVGNIMSGRLLSRGVAPIRLLSTGYWVMAGSAVIAFADLPLSHIPQVLFALKFVAVLTLSMVGGVIPGTLFALAVRLAPDESTISSTIGWMQQWSALGQFAGPPAVAWLASQVGGWQWTWLMTGTCALAGVVLSRQVGHLLRRSPCP